MKVIGFLFLFCLLIHAISAANYNYQRPQAQQQNQGEVFDFKQIGSFYGEISGSQKAASKADLKESTPAANINGDAVNIAETKKADETTKDPDP